MRKLSVFKENNIFSKGNNKIILPKKMIIYFYNKNNESSEKQEEQINAFVKNAYNDEEKKDDKEGE